MEEGEQPSSSVHSSIRNHQSSFSLIVTADDFGIGLATSRGIVRAHRAGPVTATSLMVVTGDHVRASIPLLAESPKLEVGLHLVLTRCGHRPLAATAASGLLGRDGQFLTNGQLWRAALLSRLNHRAVADEIAAQAQAFVQLMGRPPAYVDAHHHAHQLPAVREALIEVIAAGLLPPIVRTTIEPPGMIRRVPAVRHRRLAATALGKHAAERFRQAGLWSNDTFFGMLAPQDFRQPFPWTRYLHELPRRGVVEWVVHPGEPDDTLAGRDTYRAQRTQELTALTDPAQRPQWQHFEPYLARKSELARQPLSQRAVEPSA